MENSQVIQSDLVVITSHSIELGNRQRELLFDVEQQLPERDTWHIEERDCIELFQ